jgi:DNA segregation ATPase FtsK/SpoIIIE-like protein
LWEPGSGIEASDVLEDLVEEMERRYQRFSAAGTDSIAGYVDHAGRPTPRIVCLCDEYYALIAANRNERRRIEEAVSLLGAKGRAAGIHLILATQQPSRRVIEGPLDANIPCRVGLMTAKALESRMLLGTPGAEQLSGYGDLLCKDLGTPRRLQAPFLSPETRKDVFTVSCR